MNQISNNLSKVFIVNCTDPYLNLAFENYLFRSHQKDKSNSQILILWRNRPSIIMGKFQNPWIECQVQMLKHLNIDLVRRQSGGGCVYHDLGNLNYSFISPKNNYDKARNADTIINALSKLNVEVFSNERHDLRTLSNGVDYKVSGCAFKETRETALHHGTLLLNADLEILGDLLRPKTFSKEALGVKSVISKVINLKSLYDIDDDELIDAIVDTFKFAHDSQLEVSIVDEESILAVESVEQKFQETRHWDWIFGGTPKFSFEVDGLTVTVKNAIVIATDPQKDNLIGLKVSADSNNLDSMDYDQRKFISNCLTNVLLS